MAGVNAVVRSLPREQQDRHHRPKNLRQTPKPEQPQSGQQPDDVTERGYLQPKGASLHPEALARRQPYELRLSYVLVEGGGGAGVGGVPVRIPISGLHQPPRPVLGASPTRLRQERSGTSPKM